MMEAFHSYLAGNIMVNKRRLFMKKSMLFILVLSLMVIPINGYSKTVAYLFANDEILKLDAEMDTITTRIKSVAGIEGFQDLAEATCAVDLVNKYLITLTDAGQNNRPGFYIYNLLTLQRLKFVSFPGVIKEPVDMKIIYPQQGAKFYVEINDVSLNDGTGGVVNLAYDKKTQNYIETANNVLNNLVDERFWFSEDQNTIYAETAEGNIRSYDSQTLMLTKSTNLFSIYAPGLWSKSVKDIKNGMALLKENKKLQLSDKNNFSFLSYNIIGGTATPRFATEIDDKASLLTPDAKKIIINEAQPRVSAGSKAPKKGPSATGRIHVYDVATGYKLGTVTLPIDFGEKILGIKPTSDKLYYLSYSRDESKIRLFIVDLIRFRVIKDIYVPNLYFMVFFEE